MKHVVVISSITVAIFLTTLITIYHRPLLESMQLWPEPEKITELYFTEPTKLPSEFTPGTNLAIGFTLRNLEHHPTTYSYTIEQTSTDNQRVTLVKKASTQLDHSQQARRDLTVIPTDLPGSSQIVVTVTYRPAGTLTHDKQLIISHWLKNAKEV